MKKNQLISMVAFVLTDNESRKNNDAFEFANSMLVYAIFLNTPLNISQFVPAIKVEDKWEVLEKPKNCITDEDPDNYCNEFCGAELCHEDYHKQYQTAKDNVIFKGFEVELKNSEDGVYYLVYNSVGGFSWIYNHRPKTIQGLIKYKPTLTKKGLEVSGLNR